MGVVYMAEDTKLERKVALKFLPTQYTSDLEIVERFKREAKAAASLNHPNIITVHEVGEHEGQTFIAMEYVKGESLRDRIKQQLAPNESIELISQVCDGLSKAHKADIVHRDIKPENIMIDEDGRVRILDFGLAKLKNVSKLTQTATTLGTLNYISPEQLQGLEVDARSDIWSVGVVLYEMITGQLPFKGDYEAAVSYAILSEEPEPLARYKTGVSDELQRIVDKALRKDVNTRYQSAADLLADLKGLQRSSTTVTVERPEKRRRNNQIRRYLAPLILVIAASVAYYFYRGKEPAAENKRVVVSLFENLTDDASLDPLSRMSADWIAQGIAQLNVVEVVPTAAVLRSSISADILTTRRQKKDRLLALAEETGAGIVISGSFYLLGDTLHFQTQIIDVEQGRLIDVLHPVKGSRKKPMAIVESLTQKITGFMATRFVPQMRQQVPYRTVPTFKAYQEYMAGLELFGTNYPEAIPYFVRSAELDSTFMLPRVYIACAYINQGAWSQADSMVSLMNQHREKLTPYARYVLDWLKAKIRGNIAEALQFDRKAWKLDPKNFIPNTQIGLDAILVNRPQETVDTYAEIDPKVWYNHIFGAWRFNYLTQAYHMLGNHKKELEVAGQALEYYPQMLMVLKCKARALAALEQIQELNKLIDEVLTLPSDGSRVGWLMLQVAQELRVHGNLKEAEKLMNRTINWFRNQPAEILSKEDYQDGLASVLYSAMRWQESHSLFTNLSLEHPDDIDYRGALGTLAARIGDEKQALRIAEELKQLNRPYLFGNHTYWRACIMSLLGDREQAVTLLRSAFSQGYGFGIFLHTDMDLEPLRDYGPFQELLRPKG